MRNSTLLFLIKKEGDVVNQICLAMKKRGFGANRYNGVGGKVSEGESIEDATIRETREEILVDVQEEDMMKVGKIKFTFPAKPDWDQMVHIFLVEKWKGEPVESEEMKPEWFSVSDIPFASMWPDDVYWLPKVLEGNLINAAFSFGEEDSILDQQVEIVEKEKLY